jgi:hypothetical protein
MARYVLGPLPREEVFAASVAQGMCDRAHHLRSPLDAAGVAPRTRADGRGHSGPRPTDRHGGLAGEGSGAGAVLSARAARPAPCRLVECEGIVSAPGPAADPLGPASPGGRGSDDTRERRWGPTIRAKGIARDPVRSAHSQVVNGRGWRWWSLLRLGPMPWGPRFWALPGVPGLAPSEHYPRDRGQQHQKLPAGARQRRLGIRRWGPARHLVLVPEPRCAVITGRWRLRRWAPPRGGITRVRGAAARSAPAPPHQPRPHGRPRLTGERQPTLAPVLRQPAPDCTTGTGRGW